MQEALFSAASQQLVALRDSYAVAEEELREVQELPSCQ
jgi:hypothetical protein